MQTIVNFALSPLLSPTALRAPQQFLCNITFATTDNRFTIFWTIRRNKKNIEQKKDCKLKKNIFAHTIEAVKTDRGNKKE